jgi:glycosyltransferase involved in cell wall biosynthesis
VKHMTPTISVITPTLNAANSLPELISSLRNQTDKAFEFVVIDGGSNDDTPNIIANASDIVTCTISQPDNGPYDAMNKAINLAATNYYLVVGSDDTLYPDAVANFKSVIRERGVDIVVAAVDAGGVTRRGFHRGRSWLGHPAMITSHSVGMLFRKDLHARFGAYSLNYPLLADGFFIKQVCGNPEVTVAEGNFVAGRFGLSGKSNQNFIRSLCEMWQVQVDTGENPLLQYVLFQLRLLRYLPRVVVTQGNKQRPR